MLKQNHCNKEDLPTDDHHMVGDFFNLTDGCRRYTKVAKGTITPASHGVVAGKHCMAIAKIRLK